MRVLAITTLSVLAAFWMSACGGPDPEEQLAAASKELAAARSDVEGARAAVEQKQGRVDDAKAELEKARDALRKAEDRLAQAASRVDVRATDDVLFRAVQRRLLEDGKLEGVAIKATVKDGVVTLAGRVPKEKLEARAVEVAQNTPGVVRVQSQIQVDLPAVATKPE